MRATCAVAVVRDGRHVACGQECERVFGGLAEDGVGGPGVGWECPVHGCVGAKTAGGDADVSDHTYSEQSDCLDWADLVEARNALALADEKLASAGLPERGQARDHLAEAQWRVGAFIHIAEEVE